MQEELEVIKLGRSWVYGAAQAQLKCCRSLGNHSHFPI